MNLFVTRTWLEAKFAKDEQGASMVEYILLVALIAARRDRGRRVPEEPGQQQVQRRGQQAQQLRQLTFTHYRHTVGGVVPGFTSRAAPPTHFGASHGAWRHRESSKKGQDHEPVRAADMAPGQVHGH